MDRTVVVAVALGLGSLLLWSLLILVEDMVDARRKKWRHAPAPPTDPRRERDAALGRHRPPMPSEERPVMSDDPRFEQLVDKWFGPEDTNPHDPWRRSA